MFWDPGFDGVFCLQGAVAGARSSKVEDTFVPLWRLFWGGIYKGIPKKGGEEVTKSLKLLGFNTVSYIIETCVL